MPGENIYDWSVTATNNGSADALINWAEGQPRASVNNSARSMMAAHAKQRNLQNGSITVAGTANALTFISGVGFTVVPANMRVLLKLNATNTASATLNMDGIGDVTIKNPIGADLTAGDLKANYFAEFVYNGTNWILLSVFLPPVVLTNGTIPTVPTGGDPNNVTVTTGVNLSALFNGLRLTLKIGATNTGPVTMNVDGLGAKPVVDQLGNPLVGGEMVAGSYADFLYDGTKWVLLAPTIAPAFHVTGGTFVPTHATWTKVAMGTKVLDIGNYFNISTYRYTPLVAGRYMFVGGGGSAGLNIPYGAAGLQITKSGSLGVANTLSTSSTGGSFINLTGITNMNGTTDYVEMYAYGNDVTMYLTFSYLQGIRVS